MRTITLLLILLVPTLASAQQPCPTCGRIHATSTLSGQSVAQARANYLAAGGKSRYRRVGGHPKSGVVNFSSVGSFEGTGYTTNRNASHRSVSTCRPSGPKGSHDDNSRTLVGDAVARGADGTFRVRIWGSPSGGRSTPIRRRGFLRRR